MEYRVVLTAAAEGDLRQAYSWYHGIHFKLQKALANDIGHAMKHLSIQPLAYPIIKKEVRRILLKRFPYALYYRLENNMVVVFSFFHSHRDPARWQEMM